MRKVPSLIKVRLTNSGDATEMPWAQDLGRTPGGARKVRLANVPFMHARPTWGDVIAVAPAADGVLTWDRRGLPFEALDHLILETGGRWALIIDYGAAPGRRSADPLAALTAACVAAGYVCEGAYAPRPGQPGRAYLAVPEAVSAAAVMATLRGAVELPLTLFHPPAETATAATTQAGRSQPGRAGATPTAAKPAKATKLVTAATTTNPARPTTATKPATARQAAKPTRPRKLTTAAKASKPVTAVAKASKPVTAAAKAAKRATAAKPVKAAATAAKPVKAAAKPAARRR